MTRRQLRPRRVLPPRISWATWSDGDDGEFFARVGALLDDAKARDRMGRAARELAETLGWEAALDGLTGMHSRLAGVHPGLAAPV